MIFFRVACFVFLLSGYLMGQNPEREWQLRIQLLDSTDQPADLQLDKTMPKDSAGIQKYLSESIDAMRAKGWWAASIDSINWQYPNATAWMYMGDSYSFSDIRRSEETDIWLEQAAYRKKREQRQAYTQVDVEQMKRLLLEQAENNGYPFASVRLDSLRWQGSELTAKLDMYPGPFIEMGDILVEGDATLSAVYLSHYLGLQAGQPYNEKKIQSVQQLLDQLSFVVQSRPAAISFEGSKANVYLYLNKKEASRFDFVLGLLPQQQSASDPAAGSRLLLSGMLEADFFNALGQGEQFSFRYEQLPPQTQELRINGHYPYLFGLPVGADFRFELYRRDTSYIDIIAALGTRYLLPGGNYVRLFWKTNATNLLTIDESQMLASRQLPDVLDVRYAQFGIQYFWQKLDYRFNPRKGPSLNVEAVVGNKRIRPNNLITDLPDTEDGFQFASLYDSLRLRSPQYRLHADASYFWPVFKRAALMTAVKAGFIIAEEPILRNEQFRIGGHQLLRGFDEERIFATNFVVSTLEYRQLLSRNSYLFTFVDLAYTENKTQTISVTDRPLGFGAGMSFETAAGIFGLSLAWGQQQQQAIEWTEPRLHFGYVNVF